MAKRTGIGKRLGVTSAGKRLRQSQYARYGRELITDARARKHLKDAYESGRRGYARLRKRGTGRASILEDRKIRRNLSEAGSSLREALDIASGRKRERRRRMGVIGAAGAGVVGAGLALALSENLRRKVLDAVFGPEEHGAEPSTPPPVTPPSETSPAAGAEEAAGKPTGPEEGDTDAGAEAKAEKEAGGAE